MLSMANRLCLLVVRGLVGVVHAVSRLAWVWQAVRRRCRFFVALASCLPDATLDTHGVSLRGWIRARDR